MAYYCRHGVLMRLDELVGYLDDYLRVRDETADPPEALNGLQVANAGEVTRLAAAVDLCEATIGMAALAGADGLLVHHGLFWGGLRPLVGPAYRRLSALIAGNIALYAAHLPLDRHPDVGNNAGLARLLGVTLRGEFGSHRGMPIGVWGELTGSRDELAGALAAKLGVVPRLLPFGPAQVRRVGIVTGAGGTLIPQAAAAGLDTFITGEGPQATPEEAVVNEQPVGPGLGSHPDRRFAKIDSGGEASDLAGVGHLQPVQRLGRIGGLVADAEVVVQVTNELVQAHQDTVATVIGHRPVFHMMVACNLLCLMEIENPHAWTRAVWITS